MYTQFKSTLVHKDIIMCVIEMERKSSGSAGEKMYLSSHYVGT